LFCPCCRACWREGPTSKGRTGDSIIRACTIRVDTGRGPQDKAEADIPWTPHSPYRPEALILAPTRELAIQIEESIQGYGQMTSLGAVVIFGGTPRGAQMQKMARHPQILVATPGRLLDYVQDGLIDLNQVVELVLDEADRMLDMGFINDMKKIAKMTSEREQTLLFSATMPPEIEELGAFLLRNPQRVAIAPKEVAVDRIRQCVYHLEQVDKLKLLKEVILEYSMYKVIVFTRTKHRAARVAKVLQKAGIPADAIHGDRNQNQRQKALAGLKSGKVQALVATDVAARGIDVDDVTHVINFEIPHESESYVHRIGRTARAGSDGDALSFCNPEEVQDLWAIEKLIGKTLPVVEDHEYRIDTPVKPVPGQKKQGNQRGSQKAGQKSNQRRNRKDNRRSNPGSYQKKTQRSQPKGMQAGSQKRDPKQTRTDNSTNSPRDKRQGGPNQNPRDSRGQQNGNRAQQDNGQRKKQNTPGGNRSRQRSAGAKARDSIMEALGRTDRPSRPGNRNSG
jgi:ATP-dependent RNA helicase RhlE